MKLVSSNGMKKRKKRYLSSIKPNRFPGRSNLNKGLGPSTA
jgi:hypothetical protein